MQLIIPWCAFWVSAESFVVGRDKALRSGEMSSLTTFICISEGSACALIGIVHICGQWGPYKVFPSWIHDFFTSSFMGCCYFSNFVMAISMREEVESFRTGRSRKPILEISPANEDVSWIG